MSTTTTIETIAHVPTANHEAPSEQHDADIQPLEASIAEDETHYPTGIRFWLIILCTALVVIFMSLDMSILATAVPSITDDFHTMQDVGWYSSALRLSSCSFQFMFGKMYKLYPIRPVFLAGIAIFSAGSLLSALAPSSPVFVLSRAICGVGTACAIQGCFTLLVYVVPLRIRPMFAGSLGGIESIATIAAPILGGVIVGKLDWRWCFWINLPTGVLTFIITAFAMDIDRTRNLQRLSWKQKLYELDILGNMLFVPSLTCLFLALTWAGTKYPWSSGTVIGLFIVFIGLLVPFGWIQWRRGDSATIPLRIVRNRNVFAGFLFILCTNSALNVFEYYLPTYFQVVREESVTKSGYMMVPAVLGFMFAMIASGSGVSYLGYYAPFMLFGSALMPIFAGLMTTLKVDTDLARIICYSAALGFSGGIGFQSPQTAVQTSLKTEDVSLGLAVILFAQNFGPAVFTAVAQTIFTNRLSDNLQTLVPGLSADAVSQMGLSDLKNLVGPANLGKALVGLDKSLMEMWFLNVGLTCITMVGSLAMEWRSVKERKRQ